MSGMMDLPRGDAERRSAHCARTASSMFRSLRSVSGGLWEDALERDAEVEREVRLHVVVRQPATSGWQRLRRHWGHTRGQGLVGGHAGGEGEDALRVTDV